MQEEIKADEFVQAAAAAEALKAMMNRFRFRREQIDSIRATPSFIGLSASFESQASWLKLVVPRESLQQLVKAGQLMMERMGSVPDDGRMEIKLGVVVAPMAQSLWPNAAHNRTISSMSADRSHRSTEPKGDRETPVEEL